MRRNFRALPAVLLSAVPLFASPSAKAPSDASGVVAEVRIEGNQRMSDQAVRSLIRTRKGLPYSEKVAREDEKKLLRTRRFSRVVVRRAVTDRGVVVIFQVTERPVLAKVAFAGNKALSDEALSEELMFRAGDPASLAMARAGRQALVNLYQAEGYAFARVRLDRQALEDRQIVRYQIVEGPKVHIEDIVLEGNEAFSDWRLKGKLGVSERLWPFIEGVYDAEQVQRDVLALRNLYISEGFLEADVDVLPAFSDDKREVTLRYVIREGPRFRAAEAEFRGNTVFTDAELARRLELQRGEFVTSLALQRDVQRIEDTYGQMGYIEASVSVRKVYHSPEARVPDWARELDGGRPALLDLAFTVREADQFRVGRIDIQNNDITQDRVIRRELRFFPEQLYNTVAVEQSRRRLAELGLFDEVKITPTADGPGHKDVVVEVTEGQTAQFLIGAGISTNQGLLGSISFRQRNFDLFNWPRSFGDLFGPQAFKGGGQTLSVVAEPGTDLMRFHVDWREPYLFDLPYSLSTRAFVFTRGREGYDEQRYGGVLSVGHRFKNRWYGELSGRIEGIEMDNLDLTAAPELRADAGSHAIVGLKGTLVRDRTDSRWLPSEGDRINLSYEQVVGDFTFGRAHAGYRIYRTLYVDALDRKHILAARTSIGQILGDAPVFERFFGGGLGSIRGFEYRGISPRSRTTDDPIGGETTFFAGTEYSFPLVGDQLRGVLFLDSGTIEEDFSIDTYRVSAGFGLRWTVPLFGPVPMTFDFGFPLVKEEGDEEQVFSFTIGWTF